MSIEPFIEDLRAWAADEEGVLAVGLCGSHAWLSARPDSDIDLVVICRAPGQFLVISDWTSRFGKVAAIEREDYGLLQSLRTFYADGREVEFGIAGIEWCDPPIDAGTARVIADGFVPLHDPLHKLRNAIAWVNQHRFN